MAAAQFISLIQLRARRIAAWLRGQFQFTWLESLDSDYREWKPEGPIYERLIR
ncbi:hypothetical protein [Actomonas aquatica]|uniref:Uncharacterized protein n=1 Tax=Actomonas aquatica TaxID=2866162 RepID=A0ABZ1CDG4_9BACT|nr:hypothetical protein [Opitutus sp. WL0086]WRQ89710.1 hypothetical protein K1X11_009850 [Opitutus sp. WL0086]